MIPFRNVGLTLVLVSILTVGFSNSFEYLHPLPYSEFHSPASNILIRPGYDLDDENIRLFSLTTVVGELSGEHHFEVITLENSQTLSLDMISDFEPGERVYVTFNESIYSSETHNYESWTYWFRVSESPHKPFVLEPLKNDTIPPGFPEVNTVINGDPAEGFFYLAPSAGLYKLIVLDENAAPVYYNSSLTGTISNFHYVNDSLLVFANQSQQFFVGMDNQYNFIDTFSCVNGQASDFHDFALLDNGNAVMLSFDQQIVDMSVIVPGGNPSAAVTGVVIQEVDPNNNLVFEWRSWDHFEITDGLFQGFDTIDFTANSIRPVHCNSIEIDSDGNWIISNRNMSEVTKISRQTGEIMWRMGGQNNEFTFINDPLNGFFDQHDASRTPTGTLMIFDNGLHHIPPQTRVVEYQIDEVNKTATLVWQHSNPNGDVSQITGNAQRLSNGNTFISWGRRTTIPSPTDYAVEVDSLGNNVLELFFPQPPQVGFIYRIYKLPWNNPDITTSNSSDSFEADYNIKLFPNPASNEISILVSDLIHTPSMVDLYDIKGIRVFSQRVAGPVNEISIPIENIPTGVYVLRLSNPQYNRVKKFVISR